jgi:hypothetical protein
MTRLIHKQMCLAYFAVDDFEGVCELPPDHEGPHKFSWEQLPADGLEENEFGVDVQISWKRKTRK